MPKVISGRGWRPACLKIDSDLNPSQLSVRDQARWPELVAETADATRLTTMLAQRLRTAPQL
ncbi:hypothetical protein [Enhygromyxa salina]|uniref:hypothetical protein n=1 Tax=Enhygromyxa salina TaxID=215803 RepID=UPI000D0284F5|nr:hypothetical protein [Enhygromyxa salina]